MSGLSFKFTKSKDTPKLGSTALPSTSDKQSESRDEQEEEKVEKFEDGEFKSQTKEKKAPLVIPMIERNRWKVGSGNSTISAGEDNQQDNQRKKHRQSSIDDNEKVSLKTEGGAEENDEINNDGESDLEKAARAALLQDAKTLGVETDGGLESKSKSTSKIPLLFKNQVPGGFETDDKLDVSLRPNEPEEADYTSVPIEDYGMALLRGMGWDEGQPIGLSNKGTIKAKIPELRPKGLGLGANRSLVTAMKNVQTGGSGSNQDNSKKSAAEDKTLRIGTMVKVTARGPHSQMYGKISSFDEDNSRVLVRLALGGAMASVSMVGVEVVSAKEYDKESKCINKSKYDSYKAAQAEKNGSHIVDEAPLDIQDFSSAASSKKKRKKDNKHSRSRGDSPPPEKVGKLEEDVDPWLRADIRVRFVDEQDERHYRQKMNIVDVVSRTVCTCMTDKGILLEDVQQAQLETVIPRSDSSAPPPVVMILRGKYAGQVATILEKSKSRCTAKLQLMYRKRKIVDADFDGMSQFIGDVSKYEQ